MTMTSPCITIKSRLCIVLGFVLLYFPLSQAHAQSPVPANKPIEVLFVGDSFTHGKFPPVLSYNNAKVSDLNYNLASDNPRFESHPSEPGPWGGIPGIFLQLTENSGLQYKVSIEAMSAKSLTFHLEQAKDILFQAKWDIVVLQELTKNPLPDDKGGAREKFLESVKEITTGLKQQNPNVRIYLYQTWPIADDIYPESSPYHSVSNALEVMTKDVYDSYLNAAHSCCTLIPVGNAWLKAIRSNIATDNPSRPLLPNQINLWGEDNRHPSVYGAYLSALVIYATITGLDPTKLQYEKAAKELGISSSVALELEKVAAAVTHKKTKPGYCSYRWVRSILGGFGISQCTQNDSHEQSQ